MVSFNNISLNYDPNSSLGENLKDNVKGAGKAVVESLVTQLISGGGAAELAASPARGAASTSDNANSISEINATSSVFNQIVMTVTQAVQSGQISMQQVETIINNCLADIEAKDSEATKLNETMLQYQQENQELLQEINELTGGNYQEYLSEDTNGQDNNGNQENNIKSGLSEEDNAKLNELLQKYHNNQNAISMIQNSITQIGQTITTKTTEGEAHQQSALGIYETLNSSIQNTVTTSFNDLASTIQNKMSEGIQQQVQHAATTAGYSTADKAAAAKAKVKAAGKGILGAVTGLFTGGASTLLSTASSATNVTDAAAFTEAAGLNNGFATAANGFKTALKQLGTNLGTQFASQLTSNANSLMGGEILNLANSIENIDLKGKSIFDFSQFNNTEQT